MLRRNTSIQNLFNQILESGKRLQIKAVRPEDEGQVTCTATNAAGQDSTNFTLEVLGTLLGSHEAAGRFLYCNIYHEVRFQMEATDMQDLDSFITLSSASVPAK